MRNNMLFILFFSLIFPAISNATPIADAPDSIPGTTKIDAEGLIAIVEKIPTIVIVDARIPGDRKQGFIEGSISLPNVDTTCDALKKIIPAKNAPALYYCNGVKCGRSVESIKVAQSCGYTNIYWFRGGFEEWQAKGYPYLQN